MAVSVRYTDEAKHVHVSMYDIKMSIGESNWDNNYHIAGIFRGRNFRELVEKYDFTDKTFVDFLPILPIVHRAFKQSRRKLLRTGTK